MESKMPHTIFTTPRWNLWGGGKPENDTQITDGAVTTGAGGIFFLGRGYAWEKELLVSQWVERNLRKPARERKGKGAELRIRKALVITIRGFYTIR